MLSTARTAASAATLAAVACLALTACDSPAGSAQAQAKAASPGASLVGAPSPSAASSRAAVPSPTAKSSAGTSVSPTAAPSPSASSSRTQQAATNPAAVACGNLTVSAGERWAVTQTWENAKRVAHIQPVPGAFYFGGCGTTLYAAVRFEAAAGATSADLVQLQDEGSGRQFFRFTPSTGWAFTGSDSYPPTNHCGPAIPASLSLLWHCG